MRYLTVILLYLFTLPASGQLSLLFTGDPEANITSPLDVDSLFYWFAADNSVLDSAGTSIEDWEGVGTWTDLSGNGYNVTQATAGKYPQYISSGGPNGYPALKFDGINDFLASSSHWWGSDDFNIFVVYKHSNATSNTTEAVAGRWGVSDSLQFLFHARNASLSYELRMNADEDLSSGTTSYAYKYDAKSASFRVISTNHVGATTGNTVFVNGSGVTVTNITPFTDDGTVGNISQPVCIGARYRTSGPIDLFFQGLISEIIIYSKSLSAAEQTAIENYINNKYQLY